MYWVRLEWPHESTNRSRPSQYGSAGSCVMTCWYRRYAAGARLMAVPGWPLPTFCTASAARTRTVSTARTSRSVQPAFLATGMGREASRPRVAAALAARLVVTGTCLLLKGHDNRHEPNAVRDLRRTQSRSRDVGGAGIDWRPISAHFRTSATSQRTP